MAKTVRFETNIPVAVALKFGDGKHVEGRYGDQVMYTLADERVMYVPPIVEQRIQELGIQKGQSFEICKQEAKNGNRKTIQWMVGRIELAPQQPVSTPAAAGATRPIPNGTSGNGHGSTHYQTALGSAMASAYVASIDALLTAKEYARSKGVAFDFNEEDIRCSANSLFIQYFKQVEMTLRYGGSTCTQ